MPELPEVQTTVDGINARVRGLTIESVWSDLPQKNHTRKDEIKNLSFWKNFKKEVTGKKILSASRHGKNIIIQLEDTTNILIHMKMTGHMLYGEYRLGKETDGKPEHTWNWWPKEKPLQDPFNRFVHVLFSLSNGKSLAFCDARKFGKITFIQNCDPEETIHLKHLGIDALSETMTRQTFKDQLMKRPNKKIKTALMDQELITGIGNIYSDEILWHAEIHPETIVHEINDSEFTTMYANMKPLLNKGIDFGGDSTSDYRNIDGLPGTFQGQHNAYRLTGKPCNKKSCNGHIERKIVNGRSAHFCNVHQKLR